MLNESGAAWAVCRSQRVAPINSITAWIFVAPGNVLASAMLKWLAICAPIGCCSTVLDKSAGAIHAALILWYDMRQPTSRVFLPLSGDTSGSGDFSPSFFPHPLETPASFALLNFAEFLLFGPQSPGQSNFPLEFRHRSLCHIPFESDSNLPRVDN